MSKKIEEIILSLGLFIVGLCLFLWAEKVTNTVSIILGITALIYSASILISSYKNKDGKPGEITLAVLLLACAVVLFIKPGIIKETISFAIGIFIIFNSARRLSITLELKKNEKKPLSFITTIIGIVIGLLCIFGKLIIPDLILKFIGIMIIIYSITNIINIIAIPKNKIVTKK